MTEIVRDKAEKAGRPFAPRSAAETRIRISNEVNGQQREKRLRALYKLLRTFETAEERALEDRKISALEAANQLKADTLAQKRGDYRLRFAARPLGVQTLLKNLERLETEVAELKKALGSEHGKQVHV